MKAPDTLKTIINDYLDKHWDEIIEGTNFSELTYIMDYPFCKIKIIIDKNDMDSTIIKIQTKWFM